MKKYFFVLALIFLIIPYISSQEVLLSEDVLKDSIKGNFGQNKKHFIYFYFGYGVVVGQTDDALNRLIPGQSDNFEIGFRYKFKISNFYSIGSSFAYNNYVYSIKQIQGKNLPNRDLHQRETLKSNTLSLSAYNRFNYGKRGNIIGKFIDIGAYGDWCYTNRYLYKDDLGSGVTSKTVVKGLRFYEPFYYGLYANIGFNKIIINAKYRISDIFKSKCNFPQMPPLIVGLQIGLY